LEVLHTSGVGYEGLLFDILYLLAWKKKVDVKYVDPQPYPIDFGS